MSTEGQHNIGEVRSMLRKWDRGDKTVRRRLLNTFLAKNTGKTSYELEQEFAQVGSLFLARLTTWMRLTYTSGTFLGLQLRAIAVFLSASSYEQYVTEFLEDGGVLTLLEILGNSKCTEEGKEEALRLLLTVSNAGRKYKEFICETNGLKAIAEFLAKSNTVESQEKAHALLVSLAYGNPKYQNQMYKSLIALMTCSSPKTQQLALCTLCSVQSKMKTANHCIVEPLLSTLRSLHPEVQNEAISLILLLKSYDVRSVLLSGLVALLRPVKAEVQQQQDTDVQSEPEIINRIGSLSVFQQQAAAAKAVCLLAEDSPEVSHELLSLGVIQNLLHTLGNREHTDAQIQASLALQHKAETLYMIMDEEQAEFLLTHNLNMTYGFDGDKSEG